jgi:hypothetical protein
VAAYGVFVALVQIAAKVPVRGVLADEKGPMSDNVLAARIGCPLEVLTKALQVLTGPDVGWIIVQASTDHRSTIVPASIEHRSSIVGPFPSLPSFPSIPEETKTPKPGIKYQPGQVDQAFSAFWNAYPANRQRARTTVRKFWIDNDLTAHAPKIMAALAKDKASAEWTKDGGKFVGNMAEWLDRDWTSITPPVASGRHPRAPDIRTWYDSLPPERQQEEASKANLPLTAVRELMNHHTIPEQIIKSWEANHVA